MLVCLNLFILTIPQAKNKFQGVFLFCLRFRFFGWVIVVWVDGGGGSGGPAAAAAAT